MYCKYIKLSSGDGIIATTPDNCETFSNKEFIEISDPVQIGTMRFPRNGVFIETHVFMPWIAVSAASTVMLPTRNIVVAVDVDDKVVTQYTKYVTKHNVSQVSSDTSSENFHEIMQDLIAQMQEDGYEDEEEIEEDNDTNDDDRPLH